MKCCSVILALTGSDVGVMVGCVVLKCVQQGTQGFELFGFFVLSICNDCVFAGQNKFSGPTTHLPRPEFYF